jgi:hypothetical protein
MCDVQRKMYVTGILLHVNFNNKLMFRLSMYNLQLTPQEIRRIEGNKYTKLILTKNYVAYSAFVVFLRAQYKKTSIIFENQHNSSMILT